MCRSSKKFLVVTLAQRLFIFLLHPKCNQAIPGPFRPSLLGKGWLVLGLVTRARLCTCRGAIEDLRRSSTATRKQRMLVRSSLVFFSSAFPQEDYC